MAFFKLRKGGDDTVSAAAPLESIDAMRRRATHRLIGAVVLVVAGVIGFPMLFDNQPRPIAVDIPIEIPDKAKARPMVSPAAVPVTAAEAPSAVADAPAPVAAIAAKEPPVKRASEAGKPAAPLVPPQGVADFPKPAIQGSGALGAARAQALLEAKTSKPPEAAAPTTEGRFVVQVGAFADVAKVKEARAKLERAGFKTYTQVVETKDGPRTRVRVGPFDEKVQAEATATRIKALDLTASILVL